MRQQLISEIRMGNTDKRFSPLSVVLSPEICNTVFCNNKMAVHAEQSESPYSKDEKKEIMDQLRALGYVE